MPWSGERDGWGRRVLAMAVLATVAFVGLLGQLWYLQALEGGRLQEMSDKNRIRVRPVAAPRGILFDRERPSPRGQSARLHPLPHPA